MARRLWSRRSLQTGTLQACGACPSPRPAGAEPGPPAQLCRVPMAHAFPMSLSVPQTCPLCPLKRLHFVGDQTPQEVLLSGVSWETAAPSEQGGVSTACHYTLRVLSHAEWTAFVSAKRTSSAADFKIVISFLAGAGAWQGSREIKGKRPFSVIRVQLQSFGQRRSRTAAMTPTRPAEPLQLPFLCGRDRKCQEGGRKGAWEPQELCSSQLFCGVRPGPRGLWAHSEHTGVRWEMVFRRCSSCEGWGASATGPPAVQPAPRPLAAPPHTSRLSWACGVRPSASAGQLCSQPLG